MPRDRITLNREQAPLAQLALERMIEETLATKPKAAAPEPITLAELKLAVAARERIVEQLGAP